MKKWITIVAFVAVLAAGGVGAQGKASFSKDPRVVAAWFADNANADKFMAWAGENLTQEQINNLQLFMFPKVDEGQKQNALEMMKLQLQQLSLEGSEAYTALDAALKASREAGKKPVK